MGFLQFERFDIWTYVRTLSYAPGVGENILGAFFSVRPGSRDKYCWRFLSCPPCGRDKYFGRFFSCPPCGRERYFRRVLTQFYVYFERQFTCVRPPVAVRLYRRRRKQRGDSGVAGAPPGTYDGFSRLVWVVEGGIGIIFATPRAV